MGIYYNSQIVDIDNFSLEFQPIYNGTVFLDYDIRVLHLGSPLIDASLRSNTMQFSNLQLSSKGINFIDLSFEIRDTVFKFFHNELLVGDFDNYPNPLMHPFYSCVKITDLQRLLGAMVVGCISTNMFSIEQRVLYN